jgi:MacB-like periplasmic core domain
MACCMLVICTALLLSGLHSALEASAGHRRGDPILLTVQAQVRPDGPEVDSNYFSEVEKRVKSVAGLSPLAWMARLPGNQPIWRTFKVQQFSSQYRDIDIAWLTPDTLKLLDNQPIAGHTFPDHGLSGQRRVAVIDQEAAASYFNGQGLGAGVIDESGNRAEIIGVVRSQVFGTFEQHAEPAIYFPMWQDCPPGLTLILKYAKWNSGVAANLRQKIQNVPGGSSAPIGIETFEKQLARSGLAGLRIATLIGGASAVTELGLSIVGLLSSQGDAERQRQRERALRIALGAQRWRIVLLVVKSAGRLALIGTVIGTFMSYALLRVMIADITVAASPPFLVWLIAPLLPAAAITIASMLPARRASAVSPSQIMRES